MTGPDVPPPLIALCEVVVGVGPAPLGFPLAGFGLGFGGTGGVGLVGALGLEVTGAGRWGPSSGFLTGRDHLRFMCHCDAYISDLYFRRDPLS